MKLTVKTVKGQDFRVDTDENATVIDVKATIQEQLGEAYPKDNLLLIHKGKVLPNDVTLASRGVDENGFVVVMVSKAKKPATQPAADTAGAGSSAQPEAPRPQAEPTAAEGQPAAQEQPGEGPREQSQQAAPTQTPADVASAQPETAYGAAASTLATGSALEDSVRQIVEMGFPKEQVVQAMRAAFNNPDRAVEYLMTGMPPGMEQPPPPRAAANQGDGQPVAPAAQNPGAGQTGPNVQPLDMFGGTQPQSGGSPAAGGPLDHLRNDARFQTLRQMVAQNPQILQPMLQELGKNNPDLLQQITENQQDFLRLLTEEPPPQVAEAAEGLMQLAGQGGHPPAAPQIEISPEDEAAIGRLEQLGFDRALCIEAFLICDKNEEVAANYLLEHSDDV